MGNSVDNFSSNKPLGATKQASRIKEAAGKPDKDVDETQSRGTHQRPTGEVVFTELARCMREIERNLQNVSVVNQHKVESIKKHIDNDRYQINAENIAEKVLAIEELLG